MSSPPDEFKAGDRPEGDAPRMAENTLNYLMQHVEYSRCPCGCGLETWIFPDRSVLFKVDDGWTIYHDMANCRWKEDQDPSIVPTHAAPEKSQ